MDLLNLFYHFVDTYTGHNLKYHIFIAGLFHCQAMSNAFTYPFGVTFMQSSYSLTYICHTSDTLLGSLSLLCGPLRKL